MSWDRETTTQAMDALADYELPAEKARELVDYEQPAWAGFHGWSVAPITYDVREDAVAVGEPRSYEGNQHPQWTSDVVGTVGVGPSTVEGIRSGMRVGRHRHSAGGQN